MTQIVKHIVKWFEKQFRLLTNIFYLFWNTKGSISSVGDVKALKIQINLGGMCCYILTQERIIVTQCIQPREVTFCHRANILFAFSVTKLHNFKHHLKKKKKKFLFSLRLFSFLFFEVPSLVLTDIQYNFCLCWEHCHSSLQHEDSFQQIFLPSENLLELTISHMAMYCAGISGKFLKFLLQIQWLLLLQVTTDFAMISHNSANPAM